MPETGDASSLAPTFSGAGMLLSAAAAIAGVSVGTILLAVGAAIVAGITIYTILRLYNNYRVNVHRAEKAKKAAEGWGTKNPEENLKEHYDKHGKEVNAKDEADYSNKAKEFKRTAKKRTRGKPVKGKTPNVKRYTKNGRYIDMDKFGKIISFGKARR